MAFDNINSKKFSLKKKNVNLDKALLTTINKINEILLANEKNIN